MLRDKGLTGKFHPTRWGIIALAVVVALATVGVTYAGMSGEPIKTSEVVFDDPFSWVVSNDDGSLDNVSPYGVIDPGDDGGGTEYDLWGPASSDDPSEPQTAGQTTVRYDKDVASTIVSLVDPYNITVALNNAYPSYYPTIFYGLINDGTVSATIESIVVDENYTGAGDNVTDNITALTVTVSGISVGQVIAPDEEVIGDLEIHVEQVAEQNHTYTIRVRITTVADWGECEGKVTWLTLRYNGDNDALITVEGKKKKKDNDNANVVFGPEIVQPGEEFTFSGNDKNGTLGTEIRIFVDGELAAKIHTSCSQPIGPGLAVGDFEVVAGESLEGGPLAPIP